MNRLTVNLLLTLALVTVVVLTWGLRRNFSEPTLQLLPGMVDHVAYQALQSNPNFADGKTLREPVQGTIARGFPPLDYQATPQDAARAGKELRNPIPDTSVQAFQRGEAVFSTFCQPCHGAGALGDGNVVKRGFPPPPSLLSGKALTLQDGQIFHIITFGQGNMPSLASQISRQDRWKVIRCVRGLQRQQGLASRR